MGAARDKREAMRHQAIVQEQHTIQKHTALDTQISNALSQNYVKTRV